jgi:formate dehydrogenase major subunit
MTEERAYLDGRAVAIEAGETILSAARRLGIEIPTLCFDARLAPHGTCRVCLVEVAGAERPHAACHTPLLAGMRVHTQSARVVELRDRVRALQLGATRPGPVDDSHPYLRIDPGACIACGACVAACDQIPGRSVYAIAGRGSHSHLVHGPGDQLAASRCVGCGACVDACPTGAITDRDRACAAPVERTTRSVCGYCGVGCEVEVRATADRVLSISGILGAPVSRGNLCIKGRYAHAYQSSAERLTEPLLRRGADFEPVGWDEAISWLGERLATIHRESGPGALAALASSRSTNEACYLLQKLFRVQLGTNNIDCCARVCHSSTAAALRITTGTAAASACFDDIERAGLIVVAGANPTEAHPVVGARILQAARRGAVLVVIDPRRTELAELADVQLQLRAGTNVALLTGIARALLDSGRVDQEYLRDRTEGLEDLRVMLQDVSVADVAAICGVDPAELERVATLLGAGAPGLFVSGLGLSELSQGVDSVIALANLAMLTGSIGRVGAGMLPLRGQNNVQGSADMGAMPDMITGYQPVTDPAVRDRAAAVWGSAPPATPGMTVTEMTAAASRGELRALWAQGEDLAQSDPYQERVLAGLRRLDLLVVQDSFMSETARFAHLVLPAAGALEQDGTFTNGERRVQRVRAAVSAPGQARPDWEAVRDVALAMGADWGYETAADVMDEVARVAPQLYGGVCFDRLDVGGLQWPCPTLDHPGSPRMHEGGFARGRGRLVPVAYIPSPEADLAEHPYRLMTGRVLDHYNVGTMTRRTPNQTLAPVDWLEMSAADAAREGIGDRETVTVQSRWGSIEAPVRISERVAEGSLFLTFHQPETHTNRLVGPGVDPTSKCPEYKLVGVRIIRRPAV